VRKNLQFPDEHGYRNCRRLFDYEMRGIIYAHKDEATFAGVRDDIPASWKQDWFDYVHSYAYPNIDGDVLKIFREYAKDAADEPSCVRFPV
jgi:hypothetical protein